MDFIKLVVLVGENQTDMSVILRLEDINFIESTEEGNSMVFTKRSTAKGEPICYLAKADVDTIYKALVKSNKCN